MCVAAFYWTITGRHARVQLHEAMSDEGIQSYEDSQSMILQRVFEKDAPAVST